MQQSQMAPSQIATLVEHQLRRPGTLPTTKGTFILHILGPPSIGKTVLRDVLAQRLARFLPCYVPCSSFVMPRRERLARSVSECSEEAYDLTDLEKTIRFLVNGESIVVPEYDHNRGICSEQKLILRPSRLIYIEGPAWLYCCDRSLPHFTLLMEPVNFSHWQKAYVFRNTHFRNYTLADAHFAFELALSGWKKALSGASPTPDVHISVEFEGRTYVPVFHVIGAPKDIQGQRQ